MNKATKEVVDAVFTPLTPRAVKAGDSPSPSSAGKGSDLWTLRDQIAAEIEAKRPHDDDDDPHCLMRPRRMGYNGQRLARFKSKTGRKPKWA